MHARVTKFTVEPGRIDDANEYYRSTVLAQARELEGFKGGVALVDRDGGNIFSFTLWENEQAMRASEEAAEQLRSESAEASGATEEDVDRYEVAIADRG